MYYIIEISRNEVTDLVADTEANELLGTVRDERISRRTTYQNGTCPKTFATTGGPGSSDTETTVQVALPTGAGLGRR